MSGESIARNALLDRDVRVSKQDLENHVTQKIPLTTEEFCCSLVKELYDAKMGPKGLKGLEEMARDIVEQPGWVSRKTPHLEPVGENGKLGIRLKDPSKLEILKRWQILDDTCDDGSNERVFEACITKEGVAYLLVLASTRSNGKAPLSWNDDFNKESFRNLPEFQELCRTHHDQPIKSSKFKVMEDWVQLQLDHLADECIETIEEFQHENGAYVKRQHPQLRFSDGGKNAHAGYLKDSRAKTWVVGSRVKLSDAEWSDTKVLFSCTADGNVSTIPPWREDKAVRSPQAWAEMLQRSPNHAEEEFKECIDKALRDAHFCEFVPTDEERERANQEAYLDSTKFNASLLSRLLAEAPREDSFADAHDFHTDTESDSDEHSALSVSSSLPTRFTAGERDQYPSPPFSPRLQPPLLNSRQNVPNQSSSLSLEQIMRGLPHQPQPPCNETEARILPRRKHLKFESASDVKLSRCLGIINSLAKFECKDKITKKGQLGEKGRGLFEVVEPRRLINSREEQLLFGWLLDEDAPYESPKVVRYAKQQGWHELIQKAIVIASEERLKQIAQKFSGKVRGISGDAYGTLVLQQLLEAALTQTRENAMRLQGNEPHGLARTIFSIFKSYFVDEGGITDSSMPSDSSDRQIVQSAVFVVLKYLQLQAWLPEEADALKHVLVILGDNPAIACSQTGCRVYQRILEIPDSCVRADVAPCLRAFALKLLMPNIFHALVKDQYGNFVIQHILKQRCRPIDEKLWVLKLVALDLHNYAIDNCARHVVQRCFEDAVAISLEPSAAMTWRDEQRQILQLVFKSNGKLTSTYNVLQNSAAAKHVLAEMRKAFQAVSQIQ